MGGAGSAQGGGERRVQGFGGERERDHWGDPGLDGWILKWIFRKWSELLDWIELALDRDRWWAFVNAVMNLLVP